MTRNVKIGLGVLGALGVVWFVMWSARRKRVFDANKPPWLDPGQPPAGVAAPLTAAQSFAANRCRPMSACCVGRTAGLRTRRTYPGTVADSPHSLVQASFDVIGDDDRVG